MIIQRSTKTPHHVASTNRLRQGLVQALPDGWHVGKDDPIRLGDSELEPDLTVIRGTIEDYLDRKPGPGDLALVVEVAESSDADDRRKAAIYAEAGIPVYWIAHLAANRIEVYTDATGPDPSSQYRRRVDYAVGQEIPLIIEGRELARWAVADLLVPPPQSSEE